jgi:hypothetical protein
MTSSKDIMPSDVKMNADIKYKFNVKMTVLQTEHRKQMAAASDRIAAIETHNVELMDQFTSLMDHNVTLNDRIEVLDAHIAELTNYNDELSNINEELTDQLAGLFDERDFIQRSLNMSRNDIKLKLDAAIKFRTQRDAAREERDEYREEIKKGVSDATNIANDGDNKCVACITNISDTVLTPCYHMVLCGECVLAMMTVDPRCPICRTHIGSHHRVYTA